MGNERECLIYKAGILRGAVQTAHALTASLNQVGERLHRDITMSLTNLHNLPTEELKERVESLTHELEGLERQSEAVAQAISSASGLL